MRILPGQARASFASWSRSGALLALILALALANSICSPARTLASERSHACAAAGRGCATGAGAAAMIGAGVVKSPATLTAQVRRPSHVGQVAAFASAIARSPALLVGSTPYRVTFWPETLSPTQP